MKKPDAKDAVMTLADLTETGVNSGKAGGLAGWRLVCVLSCFIGRAAQAALPPKDQTCLCGEAQGLSPGVGPQTASRKQRLLVSLRACQVRLKVRLCSEPFRMMRKSSGKVVVMDASGMSCLLRKPHPRSA